MLTTKLIRWTLLLLVLAAGAPAGADERGEGAFDRAMEAHRDGRYDEAAAGFIASFQAGQREETSAYNAACALARAGRRDEAFRWLEQAYAAGFDLADYLDEDDDLNALHGDPRFAAFQAKVMNGKVSRKTREGQRLAEKYDSLRQQPDAPPHRYDQLGRELLGAGRYHDASSAFVRAATREDNPATSLYNAACARSLQGQTEAALELLQRAVEEGFSDAEHLDRDDDLDNIRHDPRFAQIRALAVELDSPPYAAEQKDRDAAMRQKWQAALPRLEGAARRHPDLGYAWFNLGFARLTLGDPAAGIAAFHRAAELGYRKATSSYNEACAQALAGRIDDAFASLERAMAAGFDGWSNMREDDDLDALRHDPRFRRSLDLARANEQH